MYAIYILRGQGRHDSAALLQGWLGTLSQALGSVEMTAEPAA